MNLYQLLEGLQCSQVPADRQIGAVVVDSRQVKPGDLFVCLVGERVDSHNFAAKAVEQGAAAVVCQRDLGLDCQVLVENTRAAYGIICCNLFDNPAKKIRMVGVTGTNGKTTITTLIHHILQDCGHKAGLIGTVYTEIGDMIIPAKYTTPDPMVLQSTLARMVQAGCEFVVMEASSHGLDQRRLEGCRFETAVFTNLTQDHLDYHHTMENYYQAKKLLFGMCEKAVINLDDPTGRRLLEEVDCPCVTFSTSNNAADYTANDIQPSQLGSNFAVVGMGVISRVKLAMPGDFSVSNAMAAISCCVGLGLELEDVCRSLTNCPGVKGRAELIHRDETGMIIRDFAHTPDGLEKILAALRPFAKGRIVTLFGCPGNRDATKRPKMAKAVAQGSDFVILSSDNPRDEDPDAIIADALVGFEGMDVPYVVMPNRYDAILWALQNRRQDDILLLAGKGHEDYQVLKDETIYFDEKVIVENLMNHRQ